MDNKELEEFVLGQTGKIFKGDQDTDNGRACAIIVCQAQDPAPATRTTSSGRRVRFPDRL